MTPRWQEIFTRLLHQEHDEIPQSEVELYQAQPALGLDPALAWNEALLPGNLLAENHPSISPHAPSAWNSVRNLVLHAPFPCCIGLAPQFLQKIDLLMHDHRAFFQHRLPATLLNINAEPALDNKTVYSQLALARLAGDSDQVHRLIPQLDGETLQKNEQAAQYWLIGQQDTARQLWNNLDGSHAVIAFNRGLAAVTAGDYKPGNAELLKASKGFSETTGWHHLAELYLTVIQ